MVANKMKTNKQKETSPPAILITSEYVFSKITQRYDAYLITANAIGIVTMVEVKQHFTIRKIWIIALDGGTAG
jgi:hypothetical protein